MSYNLDDFINDAKKLTDKAVSVANDAVDYSKSQIDRAALRSQIKEKFTVLGKLCYNMKKTDADETGRMKIIFEEIDELEAKLHEADKAVNAKKTKICPDCGEKNPYSDAYCHKCGCRLDD